MVPTREHCFEIISPAGGAHAVDFVADRCAIGCVTVETFQDGITFMRRFERWAAILLDTTIPVDATNPLVVNVTTIEPAQVTPCVVFDADFEPHVNGAAAFRWQTLKALERRSMHSAVARRAQAAQYFFELDCATNCVLLNERCTHDPYRTSLVSCIDVVTRDLQSSLTSRLGADHRLARVPRHVLALFSSLQRTLLDAHFGDSASSRDDVAEGYALFGSGELFLDVKEHQDGLRRRFSNGGPNSAQVFLFCEFALAAIDAGIDDERWRIVLPGMVAACELYLIAYGDIDPSTGRLRRHPLEYYSDQPQRRVDDRLRASVLACYRNATTECVVHRLNYLATCAFEDTVVNAKARPQPLVHDLAVPSYGNSWCFATLPWARHQFSGS